jgi:branched-subunit amino acid ABC-type transport system permease component
MRAYSDNRDLALLSGINPDKVVLVAWILAAALATIAGTMYGLDKSFKPFTYLQLLLPIFAAAIVGGLGKSAWRHRRRLHRGAVRGVHHLRLHEVPGADPA